MLLLPPPITLALTWLGLYNRTCMFIHHFVPLLKLAIYYAWCVICMCDVRDSRIKERIANHQQTRVYKLFAICSFPVNKFSVLSKKEWMRMFPLVMHEVTASGRGCVHHNAHITSCVQRRESSSTHNAQSKLIFEVFTHNSHASRIVYSRLDNTYLILITMLIWCWVNTRGWCFNAVLRKLWENENFKKINWHCFWNT